MLKENDALEFMALKQMTPSKSKMFSTIRAHYREMGFRKFLSRVIKISFRIAKNQLYNFYHRCFYWKRFSLAGKNYFYFKHSYNTTWKNERIIEVPIMRKFIKNFQGKRILEVGNVLKKYYPFLKHDVIDKYEEVLGVINEDAANFSPKKKYDLIFSISTIEHIGWDEVPKEPEKLFKLFDNLIKNCLAEKGILVFTAPVGYNSFLDEYLKLEKLPISKKLAMKRISENNLWIEIDYELVKDVKFNTPFPNANAIIVGILEAEHRL